MCRTTQGMSASAVKPSSMPGVGTSPPNAGHSLLPINMMAQKVAAATSGGSAASGDASATIKPLPAGGLNYASLQSSTPAAPTNQPLSLVQDHRPPPTPTVYQAPAAYNACNSVNVPEKEAEPERTVQNGVEAPGIPSESESSVTGKQIEVSRSNNLPPPPSTEDRAGTEEEEEEDKSKEAAEPAPAEESSTPPAETPSKFVI